MFKSLRNKFLIINMSIISIVMIAAFVTIYLTMYNGIQSENKNRLESGGIIQGGKFANKQRLEDETVTGSSSPTDKIAEKQVTIMQFSPSDSPSFRVIVDENGMIEDTQTFIDMPNEAFQKAVDVAWANKKDYSVATIEGREWMYVIKPIENIRFTYENGARVIMGQTNERYQIAFLDVTDSNKTLFSLLITFLIVGIVMLFVILGISLYFANRAIRPIELAWKKQKQFITDASHELKTPLTIIHSNYDALMENREETIESQIKWLNYIKIGTDRMAKLISDLLNLAKMDASDEKGKIEMVSLSHLVTEITKSMEASIVGKEIHLSTSIELGITVNTHSEKASQLITILLDNAVKYTERAGWIRVSLTNTKHRVTLSVKNSGKGIPKEDLPKVFDRFYRVDASRTGVGTDNKGGYGLGLSIAQTITEQLHGKLTVTSIENESTAFTFTMKIR